MKEQMKLMLGRLRKPSVLLSVVSNVISISLLLGANIDENMIMQVAVIGCSILVMLGVMNNPDTEKSGFGDDLLLCANSGRLEPHVRINGKMVCKKCGAEYRRKHPIKV